MKKFRVKIGLDCPYLDIEAEDRYEAIQKYKKICGIVASEHDPLIEPVPEVKSK